MKSARLPALTTPGHFDIIAGRYSPEAIRVPSGLNATLYTSGYVECAYGWFAEGCRKRYDFVPYMDLPDGWFTKDGNSYCSEHWPMVRR